LTPNSKFRGASKRHFSSSNAIDDPGRFLSASAREALKSLNMNVLVYSGSEVNQKSLDGTLDLLRSVCLPNYTVQPLTKASFAKDPWEASCALLVLPNLKDGGPSADVEIFTPKEVGRLREYVEQSGGAFLGLGLGARFDDAQGGLEASFSGLNLGYGSQSYIKPEDQRAPLKFVDKATKISVFPITGTSAQAETVASSADQAEVEAKTVDPTLPSAEGSNKNFKIVTASPSGATIAGYLPAGKGLVALARIVTEFDNPSLRPLFRSLLSDLNLHLPPPSDLPSSADLAPLPQFLTSIPPHMDGTSPPKFIVTSILRGFFPHAQTSTHLSGNVKDIEDTFNFLSLNAEWARDLLQGKKPPVPAEENEKHILVCLDGALPSKDDTPHFSLQVYYDTLRKLRGGYASEDPQGWGIGEALIYGERVTSTQTMFDKLVDIPSPPFLTRVLTLACSVGTQRF
jgi:biotin--protein ligase